MCAPRSTDGLAGAHTPLLVRKGHRFDTAPHLSRARERRARRIRAFRNCSNPPGVFVGYRGSPTRKPLLLLCQAPAHGTDSGSVSSSQGMGCSLRRARLRSVACESDDSIPFSLRDQGL